MKKLQGEKTTVKNLEEKFDPGEDVLDYFDVGKARVIGPQSKGSAGKGKFAYPVKGSAACHAEAGRRRVVREKPARYRKKK
jgi:hypothetical protein